MSLASGSSFSVEIGDPAPAAQMGDATLERVLGVDLRFEDDLFVTGAGDLQRVRGLEAFRANLARALVTPPGGIYWRPDHGAGLHEFLGQRITAQTRFEMQNRIRSVVTADPNVESISRLEVVSVGETPNLLEILLSVTVLGQAADLCFELRRR